MSALQIRAITAYWCVTGNVPTFSWIQALKKLEPATMYDLRQELMPWYEALMLGRRDEVWWDKVVEDLSPAQPKNITCPRELHQEWEAFSKVWLSVHLLKAASMGPKGKRKFPKASQRRADSSPNWYTPT
jgi:hypothetical protein